MSEKLIIVNKLSKRYKKSQGYSLQDVSLSIAAGDKFGIFGPNGAGKTTLISILCGITKSTSGKVTFATKSGRRFKQTHIGFVPQDFALYEELTANQNLEYFGAMYHLDRKTIESRSAELLEILGLTKVAKRKVKTYSGGMKRRLNLAIGIIHNPKVLFLDEPTVGVDVQSKNAIMNFLNELNAKGTTIIYTSHHMAEAEEFCKHIAVLDHGKLVAFDNLETLKAEHNTNSLMDVIINLTGEGYRD